ncbi:MAG: DUF86 domain-containing protein [Desulfurococcales archaeon]|nr:DUF86 domain-containing protein [Desulfurococcales archaeon]
MRRVEEITKLLREIFSKYQEVKLVYLYGSYAKGSQGPLSDIDIAVMTDDPSIILDVSAEIAHILKISEEKISIIDMRLLDPMMILKIISEGVEIINRGVNIHDLISRETIEVRELENTMSRKWASKDPLDIEVIRDIIARVNEDSKDLREMFEMGLDKIVSDKHLKRSFERVLQTLIEGLIDLLRHVVAGLNLGVASYYKDYVDIAERNNIISRDVAESLRRLIPVRHMLVHRYRILDYRKLWILAEEAAETADRLVDEVIRFIRERLKGETI